jgi:DNA replicative helicase MCM subunit Mcm2 (Cdc46/Mcm family)
VQEALRLMKSAMKQSMTDPNTGVIDMDSVFTGKTASSRTQMNHLADAIMEVSPANQVTVSSLTKWIEISLIEGCVRLM